MKVLNLILAIIAFFVAFVYLSWALVHATASTFSLIFGLIAVWFGYKMWKNFKKYQEIEKPVSKD